MKKTELQQYLTQLRAKVDDHFNQTLQRDREQIQCQKGCSQCCNQRFSIFSIEAEPISKYLQKLSLSEPDLRSRIRNQADSDDHQQSCAFLIDGTCSIYEVRPLICRSHGLPIAAPHNNLEDREFDCCPLNYRSQSPHPKSILALEAINVPLVTIHRLWDKEGRRNNSSSPQRVDLADLARA